MLRGVVCGLGLTFLIGTKAFAFGLTADQMYRNLLGTETVQPSSAKSETDKPLLSFKRVDSKPEALWRENNGTFESKREKQITFEKEYSWKDIVIAVKKGQVSPFDLAEIRRLSERENAEAIELLAWMYATGTGLNQDLQKSYAYYLQAAHLGVPSAYDNVRAVYQAMTPAQRAQLPVF